MVPATFRVAGAFWAPFPFVPAVTGDKRQLAVFARAAIGTHSTPMSVRLSAQKDAMGCADLSCIALVTP
jgi:hypothetical protein